MKCCFKNYLYLSNCLHSIYGTYKNQERLRSHIQRRELIMKKKFNWKKVRWGNVSLLTVCVLMSLFVFVNFSLDLAGESPSTDSKYLKQISEQYEIKWVSVKQGDIPWNIQQELEPSKNTADLLYIAQKLNPEADYNNLTDGELVPFVVQKK